MDPNNPHRLAEARSLALHREVARRIRESPALLTEVRARVARWIEDGSVAQFYADAWHGILAGDLEQIEATLLDPGERARALRQCSPFAGVLDPRTRWRILQQVREI